MNLVGLADELNSPFLFANFNQDSTSLAVGLKNGYKIFALDSIDSLELIYESDGEDICLIERLFSSSLLAVRLIIILEESIHIHNIRDMKCLHTLRDTPPNPLGICALSTDNDHCYLAYPGSRQMGEVQIFDAEHMGTVIRVFSVPQNQKLFEFRRGVKRCVTINCLTFLPDFPYLAASSNTQTVHIFKLVSERERAVVESSRSSEGGYWMSYVHSAVKASAEYLPSQVSEMLQQTRDFAFARLPCAGKNVCALAFIQKRARLLVAAQDGYLYIYDVDLDKGGECTLLKQHRLDGLQDPMDMSSQLTLTGTTSGAPAPGASTQQHTTPDLTTGVANVNLNDELIR